MIEEQEPRVLARVGTDGSYDLIVEVIAPRPAATVVWRGDAGVPRPRLEHVVADVRERFEAACVAQQVGLRLCFFQRMPDPFVVTARVKAALAAVEPGGHGA